MVKPRPCQELDRNMPAIDVLITFFVTTALFSLIPGPSVFYALAQTLAGGRRSGLLAALGVHLACYGHIMAAAAGLSILFHAVPAIYLAFKLAGAGYLIWLGYRMFMAKAVDAQGIRIPARSHRQVFRQSVVIEVLNPKTALFFLAFLPQFVDPGAAFPIWLQFLLLGTIANLVFSITEVTYVLLADLMSAKLQKSAPAQRAMQRVGGTILVGLGTHLALQRA